MGLLDNVKKLFTKDVKKFMSFTTLGELFPLSHFIDFNSYLRSVKQVSWVYTCTSTIGESASLVPHYLYDKDNKEVTPNEQLAKLFSRPNDFQTWFEMKEAMIWYLLLSGNVYILKDELNGLGQPNKLWLLRPDRMEIVPSKTKFIAGYVYKLGTDKIPFDIEDIIHIKLPNPLSDFVGMGKIEAAEITYNTDIASTSYNWKFFENGASPSGILTNEGQMSDDSYDRLVKQFEKRHVGFKRMQKPMLLEQGTEYKQMGLSQQDMAFMEQRKFSRDEILSIFGVPPALVGVLEYASYANTKEQENKYRKDTLKPLLTRIQQKLTNEIVQLFNPNWRFEFEEVVLRDEQLYFNLAKEGVASGLLTPNEARVEYLGLEEIKEEAMNSYYMPFSLAPITGEAAEELAQATTEKEDEKEDEEKHSCHEHKKLTPYEKKKINIQTALLKISLATRKKLSKKIKETAKDYFKKQAERIIDEIKEGTELEINNILEKEEDSKDFQKEMIKSELSIVIAAYNNIQDIYNREKALTLADIEAKLMKDDPRLKKILSRIAKRIKGVNDTTLKQLRESLIEGLQESETIPSLKNRVQKVMASRASWQAVRIARTESAFAYDRGAVIGYKDNDVKRVDVIGCTEIEPEWDCGKMNVPIDEADSLEFHPNHVGTFVPSDI